MTGDLETYVTKQRAAGLSWRQISLAIRDGYDIDVTDETLRSWFPTIRRSRKAA